MPTNPLFQTISISGRLTGALRPNGLLPSTPLANVPPANNSPTGAVLISGAPLRGQLLTASNTIADADGIPLDAISYQWYANDTAILGATGSTYLLTYADAGSSIRVVASYRDSYGTNEQVSSEATARTRLADVISNVLAAYRMPSLGLDGDEDIDLLDVDLDAARLLDQIGRAHV